jgi:hypothetical protein
MIAKAQDFKVRPRAWLSFGAPKCGSCGRPTAARWARCPLCRGPTGIPRYPRDPFVDRRLDTYRAFAFGASTWFWVGAAFLSMVDVRWALASGGLGLAFMVVTLASAWNSGAWRLAQGFWLLLSALVALLLWDEGVVVLGSLAALAPLAWMVRNDRAVTNRLHGHEPGSNETPPPSEVPTWTPCVKCGSRESEVVAPLFCASFITASARWPGNFQSLCLRHARTAALAPTLFTLCLGPWGVPWGIVWSAQVAALNLEQGGVLMDSDLLRELRRMEADQGGVEEAALSADATYGLLFGLIVFATLALGRQWSGG